MEKFERLEIIVKAMIRNGNEEFKRARKQNQGLQYEQSLSNKLYSLEGVNGIIEDIKHNGTIASDDAQERIWKPIIATGKPDFKK